jgi:hypothetical protein
VTGAGRYSSGSFSPKRAGTYRWVAAYSGDPNNAATASGCGDAREISSVGKGTTHTTLSLSSRHVTSGREHSERLSVRVTEGHGLTPTGKVALTAGKTKLCTIRLSKGKGSCHLSNIALKRGSHQVRAEYTGNADLSASKSRAEKLTVRR